MVRVLDQIFWFDESLQSYRKQEMVVRVWDKFWWFEFLTRYKWLRNLSYGRSHGLSMVMHEIMDQI